jgi:hypothetical protein
MRNRERMRRCWKGVESLDCVVEGVYSHARGSVTPFEQRVERNKGENPLSTFDDSLALSFYRTHTCCCSGSVNAPRSLHATKRLFQRRSTLILKWFEGNSFALRFGRSVWSL